MPEERAYRTVVEALVDRAATMPDATSMIFLPDGLTPDFQWTFADLDHHARALAGRLAAQVPTGSRILIMAPPGLDYVAAFFACLYAGMVAVPAYPPSPFMLERDLERLRRVVEDAESTVALTTTAWLELAQSSELTVRGVPVTWLSADEEVDADPDFTLPDISPGSLAFLQYTSGSTSDPKGVMVTHGNLMANIDHCVQTYGLVKGCTVVSWLPPYHDMGLIGSILTPAKIGARLVILPPDVFLRHPVRWLQAISDYRAYISPAPNFAYDLCVRRSTPEQRAALDLSSWKVAINGAEPVLPDVVERFAGAFEPAGFSREHLWPSYGLAEATLLVCAGQTGTTAPEVTLDAAALGQGRAVPAADADQARTLLTCGRPTAEVGLRIVSPETGEQLPDGQVGEITICSPSVAAGYWARPDQTAEVFERDGDSPWPRLHTGDLGCLVDGNLLVTGRIKDLIVVRGRNHYPQDIERTVANAHPQLRPGCGAAFALPGNERELVAIVQEVRSQEIDDFDEVVAAIRNAVTEHHQVGVDAVALLAPRTIPKTSSGKVRRQASREGFHGGGLAVLHEWRSAGFATVAIPVERAGDSSDS